MGLAIHIHIWPTLLDVDLGWVLQGAMVFLVLYTQQMQKHSNASDAHCPNALCALMHVNMTSSNVTKRCTKYTCKNCPIMHWERLHSNCPQCLQLRPEPFQAPCHRIPGSQPPPGGSYHDRFACLSATSLPLQHHHHKGFWHHWAKYAVQCSLSHQLIQLYCPRICVVLHVLQLA